MPQLLSKLGLLMPQEIYQDGMLAKQQLGILKREIGKISSTQNSTVVWTVVMSLLETVDGYIDPAEIGSLVIAATALSIMQHQSKKITLLITELEKRIDDGREVEVAAMSPVEIKEHLGKHCIITLPMEEKVFGAANKVVSYVSGAANSIRSCFTWRQNQNANPGDDADRNATELDNLLTLRN